MENRENDGSNRPIDSNVIIGIQSAKYCCFSNKKCPDQIDPGILSMFKNELLQFKRYR